MLNSQQQDRALRLLRPETVRAIEGMPFDRKAKTIPSVIQVMDRIKDVEMVGPDQDPNNPEYINVREACNLAIEHEERMIVTPTHVIVGGLISDSDYDNPMEDWDGEGKIVHSGLRAVDEEERAEFFSVLGLNSEGGPILTGEKIGSFLLKRVWDALTSSHLHLMFDLIDLTKRFGITDPLKKLIGQAIESCYDEDWWWPITKHLTTFNPNDLDEDDFEMIENLLDIVKSNAKLAWEDAISDGKIGNPLAVKLDIHEHGSMRYSVSGESMQSQWETSCCDAVWVPCDVAMKNIRAMSYVNPETPENLHAAAVKYCRGVLETYNHYLSGEVYGVVVYVIDRSTGERIEDEDVETWGNFGSDCAEEELERSMLDTALRFAEHASAEAVMH